MASPFPGMDPYLEDGEIWPGFHHSLADEFMARLNPRIGPKYYADVETRTVAEEVGILLPPHAIRPDTGVYARTLREGGPALAEATTAAIPEAPIRRWVLIPDRLKLHSVRIYETDTAQLVTAIEILSPYNKRRTEGLEHYRRKRKQLVKSSVHLIEIDLLRGGERPGQEVLEPPLDTDYVLLVNRSMEGDSRLSEIWAADISQPIPPIPVPLLAPDPDTVLEVGPAIRAVYQRAGYD